MFAQVLISQLVDGLFCHGSQASWLSANLAANVYEVLDVFICLTKSKSCQTFDWKISRGRNLSFYYYSSTLKNTLLICDFVASHRKLVFRDQMTTVVIKMDVW